MSSLTDTTTPTAAVTKDERIINIDIAGAPAFTLPTLGHFGGSGKFKEGSHTEIDPDSITGHTFQPLRVLVTIVDGVVKDMGAFAERNLYADRDGCQDGRDLNSAGLATVHWPDWLTELVNTALDQHGVVR